MPSCSPACPGVLKSQIAGPIPAADSKAIETLIPVNLGSKGYDGASAAADRLRAISRADAGGLASHIAGPLGNAADSASAFSRISGTLLGATLGVVIVLLLSRGLWAHRRPHRPAPGADAQVGGAQPGSGPPGVVAECAGPRSCPRARPAEGTAFARTVTDVRFSTCAPRW